MGKSIDIAISNAAPPEGVPRYGYTYGGHKFLKTTELANEEEETRLYLGGAEFVEGQPESYYHGEGRVALTGSEPRFQYKLTDHLGNTMVLFEDRDGDGIITTESMSIDSSEVLQRNFYYAFGLPMQGPWNHAPADPDMPYLYNGKELEGELGLGWYAYGFRYYDASIGRFVGVDPLAGEFTSWSPYCYVYGNPLIFTDPDGKSGEPFFDSENNRIVVRMHYNYYGNSSSLNHEQAQMSAANIQSELNRYPSTATGPDGNQYPVVFQVSGSYVTEAAAKDMMISNVGANFDPTQNFVRVEDVNLSAKNSSSDNLNFKDGIQFGRSRSAKGGDNSIYLPSRYLNTTTEVHETVVHGLSGRGPSSHIGDWSANPSPTIPSIRTMKFTLNIPAEFQDESGDLNLSLRQVLPEDKPINIDWNAQGRLKVGGATNTFFNADRSEQTFD